MRSVEEYMSLPYRMEIVQDPDEGGFVVSFPELKGCLTCAMTMERALLNAEDAKHEWLTAALEDGYPIPEPEILKRNKQGWGRSLTLGKAASKKQQVVFSN